MQIMRRELIKRKEDEETLPLSDMHIEKLYGLLVDTLRLDGHDIAPSWFIIRRYEYFASRIQPEPSLLNSFFLGGGLLKPMISQT